MFLQFANICSLCVAVIFDPFTTYAYLRGNLIATKNLHLHPSKYVLHMFVFGLQNTIVTFTNLGMCQTTNYHKQTTNKNTLTYFVA